MKNTDKTIPYEPTPAELSRFGIKVEKASSFDFSPAGEENSTSGEFKGMNTVIILTVAVIVVMTILLVMGAWEVPASLATVSWNGDTVF